MWSDRTQLWVVYGAQLRREKIAIHLISKMFGWPRRRRWKFGPGGRCFRIDVCLNGTRSLSLSSGISTEMIRGGWIRTILKVATNVISNSIHKWIPIAIVNELSETQTHPTRPATSFPIRKTIRTSCSRYRFYFPARFTSFEIHIIKCLFIYRAWFLRFPT